MKRRQWNPYVVMFALYRKHLANKKKAILFFVLQFMSRILWLISPYIFAQMLNVIQKWGQDMIMQILPYALIMLFFPFIEWALHGPARVMERQLAFEVTQSYKMLLYHSAISLPMHWHTDNHTGTTIDKITKATGALDRFAGWIFSSVGTFISLFWALIALWLILPWLLLILLVVWFCVIMIIIYYDKKIVFYIKKFNTWDHKVNGLLVDYISNIRTLITLRFLQPTEYALNNAIIETYPDRNKEIKLNELKRFLTSSLLSLSLYIVILWYIYYSRSLTWTVIIGTIMMIYQYTERVSQSFYNVTGSYSQLVQSVANIAAVQDIEQEYDMLPSSSWLTGLWDWTQIQVSNLTFHYKEKNNILSDVSFVMKRGEKIAFVWESGSGKSTLLSLLRGLYDVEKVNMEIDGKQYDTLAPLYNDTSLIPQEPEIFEESIAFNITMWSSVSQDMIEQYSRMARFHDIALWLPHGYNTNIKEKGVNLSWWQKQRLALARGLLVAEESSMVLLDESTSSVDSINEKKIYTSIFNHFQDKTIIAAIHKLHLLTMFDTIYVFDAWKVIESGSFHDLIAQWGMLAKMREEYQASQKKK